MGPKARVQTTQEVWARAMTDHALAKLLKAVADDVEDGVTTFPRGDRVALLREAAARLTAR